MNQSREQICRNIRESILKSISAIGVGHVGGSLSIVEVLTVLYFEKMNIDPSNPKMEGRDRLVLSKGHAGPALYAVLAEKGYFEKEQLLTLNQPGTWLPSHCDMNKTPGIDMTTGSLGQGFSCAVGVALASKLKGDGATVYAIIGDGESDEGQIWEAALCAANKHANNLIAFTDYNHCQIDGTVEEIENLAPLGEKWKSFGWDVIYLPDGHDMDAIAESIDVAKQASRPTMIILETVKGKGISAIEKMGVKSHSIPVDDTLLRQSMEELAEVGK